MDYACIFVCGNRSLRCFVVYLRFSSAKQWSIKDEQRVTFETGRIIERIFHLAQNGLARKEQMDGEFDTQRDK